MDAEKERGQAEVDKEDDDAEVDDGVRRLDQSFPLADEDDGCCQAALGDAVRRRVTSECVHPIASTTLYIQEDRTGQEPSVDECGSNL